VDVARAIVDRDACDAARLARSRQQVADVPGEPTAAIDDQNVARSRAFDCMMDG
jgi:hypothetical protein